ncbi:uncharacterized protein LOC121254147 [Juglans microcarpa x Juglans regia]|uniref:uncharacterized protein LOC121254147 n=1 Tax=Juglans microcarpa x Juglans regia TaxID=2249226 RepID=UPI001B7ED95D|nr:uncharacterized protein LOC121254147 [Juglans microcarpa x Juglans regia]
MARSFFRKLLFNLFSEDELEVGLNDDVGSTSRHGRNHQRRKYIWCDHIQGQEQLFRDYFAEPPVYPSNLFRSRYHMSRPLFLRILNEVEAYEPYFIQKKDNVEKLSLSSMQTITVAIRMLAYGVTADFMDEYIRIRESTTIVDVFSNEYLRSPNTNDISRLLVVSEQYGFPKMLGSIDCMY